MDRQLILGDITQILSKTQDLYDCLVTDPPYRWNKTTGGRAKNGPFKNRWQGNLKDHDNIVGASLKHNNIAFSDWMPLAYQSLKARAHAYVFVNDKNLQDGLNAATAAGFRIHNVLCWRKNNCTPNRWYMKNIEFILFLYKGKAFKINNMGSNQDLAYINISGKNKLHPTEKPVPLLKELIENSTQPGQTVLDPFMGSGSTGQAAIESGRKFVGIELDPVYFAVAENRFGMLDV
jgi:site-specific DNA-methyltransferase (adenine-specific)